MKTAAIYYQKEGYDTQGKKLMGRQAAGEGFLRAIARYSTTESLYCYTQQQAVFEEFCQQVRPWLKSDRKINWVPAGNPLALQEAGLLYRPDPIITQLAWQRRYSDQRAYSLCGITHTLASKDTMKILGDYLIAPIQPWDALICTSQAVKTMVERLLENWAEYLAQRLNARPQTQIQLPVIPLGVDCESFIPHDKTQEIRDRLRTSLNIADNDIVVLYVGRLIFHAKAHPVPMYLALEKAAQATNTKIHLIQAGWFEDEKQESSFKQAANLFSPTVNHIFVDGRRPEIRKGIWSAADIFISLADNVQETFGLTPIEAMAVGLPVIVSDWNGYKETVRHEIDGFRIPTIMPPVGCGLDFATSYGDDSLNYSTYVGHISLMTAIDIDACAQALTTLITQPELRQRMGENGRQRARKVYDWSNIIASYENLWQELAEKRLKAQPISGGVPHPLCDDPCRVWERYPSEILPTQQRLTLGSMANSDRLEIIRSLWITNFGANKRSPSAVIDQVLAAIAQAGSLSVAEILSSYSDRPAEQVAADHRNKTASVEDAINSIIAWRTTYAAGTGFITGLGGIAAMPVTIPAGLAASYALGANTAAAIAHLRGYDIHSEQVRTMVLLCLIGEAGEEILKTAGITIGTKVCQNLIKQIPGKVLIEINKKIGFRLITKAGEKGVLNLMKMVPLVGGVVGGTFDGLFVNGSGKIAKTVFAKTSDS